MAQPTASAGFFHTLFSPLPENREEKRKDTLDHVAGYAESAEGSWDIFRFGNQLFSVIETYVGKAHPQADFFGKMKGVFDSAGVALSIPQFFSNVNALRHSIVRFFTAQDLPYSDLLRTRKIAHAAKSSFVDAMSLTNTSAQIALFLDNARVVALKAYQPLVDGVYNATGAIYDAFELAGEYFKLKAYSAPEAQPRNPAEAAKLEEKKTLAWITIAKDIASIALGALALRTLVAAALGMTVIAVSPTLVLGIGCFWLVMKLGAVFFNKVYVEVPISA